jgi:hypothetical protein
MPEHKLRMSCRSAPVAELHWTKLKGTDARREAALKQGATRAEEQRKEAKRAELRKETKRRLDAGGDSMPLAELAGREQALEAQSRANSILDFFC